MEFQEMEMFANAGTKVRPKPSALGKSESEGFYPQTTFRVKAMGFLIAILTIAAIVGVVALTGGLNPR